MEMPVNGTGSHRQPAAAEAGEDAWPPSSEGGQVLMGRAFTLENVLCVISLEDQLMQNPLVGGVERGGIADEELVAAATGEVAVPVIDGESAGRTGAGAHGENAREPAVIDRGIGGEVEPIDDVGEAVGGKGAAVEGERGGGAQGAGSDHGRRRPGRQDCLRHEEFCPS